MAKPVTSLHLKELELQVHLGWTPKERKKKQTVWLTLDINLPKAPKACHTDRLDDTVCYDQLIKTLRKKIGETPFRLIERLGYEIHRIVKTYLPPRSLVSVLITKHPDIDKLNGGVGFYYSET